LVEKYDVIEGYPAILAEEDAIIKQGELQDEEPKHVLVVDDDKVSRKTLANFLKKLGFEASTAKGGKEALMLLNETNVPFSILLVDVMMPEMDGLELLRIFKQAYSQDIPIISMFDVQINF
jgi:CheY-like chemotaxis protein